jgi:RNA-directed DNA polymerase
METEALPLARPLFCAPGMGIGRTIFRELCARGMGRHAAAQVAANGRRWWRNSAMAIHIALPNTLFDKLGVPRLGT